MGESQSSTTTRCTILARTTHSKACAVQQSRRPRSCVVHCRHPQGTARLQKPREARVASRRTTRRAQMHRVEKAELCSCTPSSTSSHALCAASARGTTAHPCKLPKVGTPQECDCRKLQPTPQTKEAHRADARTSRRACKPRNRLPTSRAPKACLQAVSPTYTRCAGPWWL